MKNNIPLSSDFEVIIIGGSYAGLSAAMALGRSLRRVLIIDEGEPCNRQTPHSHNFLTRDGETPAKLSSLAKQQVEKYSTLQFYKGLAVKGTKTKKGFQVEIQSGEKFQSKKLIVATGIKDIMPDIKGFAVCWGISAIHCPYCHGYEFRDQPTGIITNGDEAMHYAPMIKQLTYEVTIFTNGPSTLAAAQRKKMKAHHIPIIETPIESFKHRNGKIEKVIFKDGSAVSVKAVYARLPFVQHTEIPKNLGCEITEQGFIKVNEFQKTNVPGIFSCGDNSSPMRSVANAVSSGNFAGAMVNRELCVEGF